MKPQPRLLMLFVLVLVAACASQLGGASRAQANGTPPFTDIGASLTDVWFGTAGTAWGDYNSDGKLDALVTGMDGPWGTGHVTTNLYRNDGGSTFTNIGASLTGVIGGPVAWGDYDNDGDLDILLVGQDLAWPPPPNFYAKIYENNGDGTFSEDTIADASLTGVSFGQAAWGDYDNDGRLDILLSGKSAEDPASGVPSELATKLYRNNGDGTFSENTSAVLPGATSASVAWGDYNSDGRLDILFEGCLAYGSTCTSATTKVFRNNGDGSFTDIGAGLQALWAGSAVWGDYDSDGRLDILVVGEDTTSGVNFSKLYRNNGDETFSENTSAGLIGVVGGTAAWGDYDSDGKLDILMTGYTEGMSNPPATMLYRNNGDGSFTDIDDGLIDLSGSAWVAWGDYDVDGKLDILLTGGDSGDNPTTKIYRNETGVSNSAPSAPSGLAYTSSGSQATLSWNAASDTTTPAAALTYNLRVGTTPGGSQIVSPMTLSSGLGLLPQMGNGQEGTNAILEKLPAGTYYWSVQAIDAGFAGSPFAAEKKFVVTGPTISFSSTSYSAGEGDGHASITIARAGLTSGTSSITIKTADGTATAGSDYTAIDQTVTFSSGQTAKTISIPITDDFLVESNETVQLALSNPSSGTALANPSSAVLTIKENDLGFTDINANLTGLAGRAAWGDYNSDGKPDILIAGVAGNDNDPATIVYRNNGDGSFTDINAGLIGVHGSALDWGDYNNDGKLDILLTGCTARFVYGADTCLPMVTKIYRNDGDDTFTEDTVADANLPGTAWGQVSWGDYNNDGWLDILGTGNPGSSGAAIYRNNGDGTFTENTSSDLTAIGEGIWGDYNSDGRLDILGDGCLSHNEQGGCTHATVELYRNNGDETFTDIDIGLPDNLLGYYGLQPGWADYDSDGDLDLLLMGQVFPTLEAPWSAKLYRNSGDGSFTEVTNTGLTGIHGMAAEWGDYDSDGKPDILISSCVERYGNPCFSMGATIYRNNGDGTFTDINAGLPSEVTWSPLVWGDYNSDGRLDILLTSSSSDGYATRIFRNEGRAPNTVEYTVEAFAPPIDNPPTVNKAKAGQTIPVKWRLTDASGAPVSDPASFVSVTSGSGTCSSSDPIDAIESYAGDSGLQYLGDGWWQFNWKTPKAYAGQCRVMRLNLASGQPGPFANFQFK